jgi:hypothetical protein
MPAEVFMDFATTAKYWRDQASAKVNGLGSAADELRETALRAGNLVSNAIGDGKRVVTQSVRKGRFAAEDGIAGTTLLVRRRPLASIATAFASGVVIGGAALYALGRGRKR